VEATRDWSRTWRIPLVTDLGVLLGCFVAFHVPGQTARFRGFTKGDKQNGRENCPITFELHFLPFDCWTNREILPVSRAFSTVPRWRFAFDIRHNGQAKAKATANKVSRYVLMLPRHFAITVAVREGNGPIAPKAEPIEETQQSGVNPGLNRSWKRWTAAPEFCG
jgi:hypothetical protein